MSRRQKKVERLAQRHPNGVSAKETAGGTRAEEPMPNPPTRVDTPATNGSVRPEEPGKVDATNGSKHPEEPGPNSPATPTVESANTKPPELRVGFTNDVVCAPPMYFFQAFETNIIQGDKFSPLADLKQVGAFCNVVGVVVRCTPAEKSRKGGAAVIAFDSDPLIKIM